MKAITTKFMGPTNHRGARIKASDCDGNSATVSYDYSLTRDGEHHAAAIALCKKMGWGGRLYCGGLGNGNVYVFDPKCPIGSGSVEIID